MFSTSTATPPPEVLPLPPFGLTELQEIQAAPAAPCPHCRAMVTENFCETHDLFLTRGHNPDCPTLDVQSCATWRDCNDHAHLPGQCRFVL